MANQQTTALPVVQTLASTDKMLVIANGTTSLIAVSDYVKQYGGSGASGGASGSTNLMPTPTDLSGGTNSKWVIYSQSGGISRPGGGRIVIVAGTTTSNVVYVTSDPSTGFAKGGQQYTFGATVTRAAGTGTGAVRGNTYYEGSQTNAYSSVPSVTDGTPFRVTMTFTVSATSGVAHIGFDFTPGGGDFQFSNVTLVAGAIDNPNAA